MTTRTHVWALALLGMFLGTICGCATNRTASSQPGQEATAVVEAMIERHRNVPQPELYGRFESLWVPFEVKPTSDEALSRQVKASQTSSPLHGSPSSQSASNWQKRGQPPKVKLTTACPATPLLMYPRSIVPQMLKLSCVEN